MYERKWIKLEFQMLEDAIENLNKYGRVHTLVCSN